MNKAHVKNVAKPKARFFVWLIQGMDMALYLVWIHVLLSQCRTEGMHEVPLARHKCLLCPLKLHHFDPLSTFSQQCQWQWKRKLAQVDWFFLWMWVFLLLGSSLWSRSQCLNSSHPCPGVRLTIVVGGEGRGFCFLLSAVKSGLSARGGSVSGITNLSRGLLHGQCRAPWEEG